MPVKIKCKVEDSRGLPVEGIPVYLASNNFSFAGLTGPRGDIKFIIPKRSEAFIYIYNPMKKDFIGEWVYADKDRTLNLKIIFDLKSGVDREDELTVCKYCNKMMYLGDRVYVYRDKMFHYDCFHNNRKRNYINKLKDLLQKIESNSNSTRKDADNEVDDLIVNYLQSIGFIVREDVPLNYHMHYVEVFEAVNNMYDGRDFILDILAVYPGFYPDLNLILAISLYNSYRRYLLDLVTFTPYKIIVRGWGEKDIPGIYRPSELPEILREIINTEMQLRGICG